MSPTARLVLALAALALLTAQGQTLESRLLPSPVTLSGTVVDAQGVPIPEVRIDYLYPLGEYHTKLDGRFRIETRAPAVVFRKVGFEPIVMWLQDGSDITIAMKKMTRAIGACSDTTQCVRGMRFCFPKVYGVTTSSLTQDVDYVAYSFITKTAAGWRGLTHGSGFSWNHGEPPFPWGNTEYFETDYDDHGRLVMDARGKDKEGRSWRWFGAWGESVDYFGVVAEDVLVFDKVLDGAFINPADPSSQH